MSKSNSCIRIIDPTSSKHMVRLNQDQCICLWLNKDLYESPSVIFSNDNLYVHKQESAENFTKFYIKKSTFVDEWANYSSNYLGEIWVESKSKSCRLIVILDSSNESKYNFITVFDPESIDLRIFPGNILEVILINDFYETSESDWIWKWDDFGNDVGIELLGRSVLHESSISDANTNYPYAKLYRNNINSIVKNFQSPNHIQNHFWFRFDKSILSFSKRNQKISNLGCLTFECLDKMHHVLKFGNLNLDVDCRKNQDSKILNSLLLFKLNNSKQINNISDDDDDYEFQTVPFKSNDNYAYKDFIREHLSVKNHLPLKEVVIIPIEFDNIDDECKIITDPVPKNFNVFYDQ